MKLLPALLSFISLLIIHFSEAQEVFTPVSRFQALGNISVCMEGSGSVFGNQAGLSKINHLTMGGSFQNRFLVKELSTSAGLFIIPVKSSVFALSFYQFGKHSFRQEKLGIAFARSLGHRLHAGLQFNYYRHFLPEENKSIGTYGVEVGFQYQLMKRLLLGLHILNPYQTNIQTLLGERSYPTRFSLGSYIRIANNFGLASEMEKELHYPVVVKTGLEYDIIKRVELRTGFSGKPYQLTAGMGFAVRKLKVDLAVAYNQYLGNSPSATFQYQF